ncbi:MAG: Uma2 family endonuclease [Thermoanaerobaculia bacterium]
MAILQRNEERLMTGEELARHPELQPCELVNGRVVPMTLTEFGHGDLALEIGARLRAWAKETGRGRTSIGDVAFYTRRDPDSVRGADVVYISHERYGKRSDLTWLDVTPELLVEVFSSDGRWSELTRKAEEYLAAGALRVWLVHPRRRQVVVHRPDAEPATLGLGDTLLDEEVLPGFSLPLSELFQD